MLNYNKFIKMLEKLREYLNDRKITNISKKIGKSPAYLLLVLTNRVNPPLKTIKQIYLATDGFVTPDDFYDFEEWQEELKNLREQKLKKSL